MENSKTYTKTGDIWLKENIYIYMVEDIMIVMNGITNK